MKAWPHGAQTTVAYSAQPTAPTWRSFKTPDSSSFAIESRLSSSNLLVVSWLIITGHISPSSRTTFAGVDRQRQHPGERCDAPATASRGWDICGTLPGAGQHAMLFPLSSEHARVLLSNKSFPRASLVILSSHFSPGRFFR